MRVEREIGDNFVHRERRNVPACRAVAELAGRDDVRLVNAIGQLAAFVLVEMRKPYVNSCPDLGRVTALRFSDEMFDRELPPEVEVDLWPRSASAQLADSA
ncbi:MAG TPA: hypothetical protein PKA95_14480 [Thermomicrobiales bacterium]|nr:hypothetical protein [Thermomicrobiales bacterium]